MHFVRTFTIDQENDQISDLGPPWGLYLCLKKVKLLVGEDVERSYVFKFY